MVFLELPVLQKDIIKKARNAGKPIITATQMLLSMVDSPYPTRAEVSDVSFAFYDGSDAVMLSEESAVGKYPVKVVEVLDGALRETETIYNYTKVIDMTDENDAISSAVVNLARNIKADGIVSFTRSGSSAKHIAKFRPECDIFVNSTTDTILRGLSATWGVIPSYVIQDGCEQDMLIGEFFTKALKDGIVSLDKKYVVAIGVPGAQTSINLIRVMTKIDIEGIIKKWEQNIK